jgi:hypothetical protein
VGGTTVLQYDTVWGAVSVCSGYCSIRSSSRHRAASRGQVHHVRARGQILTQKSRITRNEGGVRGGRGTRDKIAQLTWAWATELLLTLHIALYGNLNVPSRACASLPQRTPARVAYFRVPLPVLVPGASTCQGRPVVVRVAVSSLPHASAGFTPGSSSFFNVHVGYIGVVE